MTNVDDHLKKMPVLRGELLAAALLVACAALFLFTNLGAKYLWQDEAATAVLGERLVKFGKPLAYDGVNLITMDHFAGEDADTIGQRTGRPETAVRYYADHKDFKQDTTWVGQPWGQFVAVGLALKLFGHNTVAARLPFAVSALLTVALLYWFVRQQFRDRLLAWLAAAMLVTNVFWVVHGRQCRYYSLSSLFLLLTLAAFIRWQRERRYGAPLFIAAAWCWFQVDYGSFWPMLGILLLTTILTDPRRWQRVLWVNLALGATIVPWVWYYEIATRLKTSAAPWSQKFQLNLLNFNQFLIPLVLLVAGGALLAIRWRALDVVKRQVLSVSLAMLLAALLWVPTVTPYAFYRYIVHLSPLAALVAAWVLVEAAGRIIRERGEQWRILTAAGLAAFVVASPLLSGVGHLIKPDWGVLHEEVFSPRPDPNRLTVQTLAGMATANDEVLTNYEDIPLMFYTPYRIRGGIPCFRVEDDAQKPPRFLIYRRSVTFVHAPVFDREISRYAWRPIDADIPDIPWGNNPDPRYRLGAYRSSAAQALVGENIGPNTASATRGPEPGQK